MIDRVKSPRIRIFPVANAMMRMNERVVFPVRAMLGVIGVSPASGDVSTFFADRHGGNMDDHVNGIGATIHLPVSQSGGQLAIGAVHASMGDGEISGTGVEIGATVLVKVDVIKGNTGGWQNRDDRRLLHARYFATASTTR